MGLMSTIDAAFLDLYRVGNWLVRNLIRYVFQPSSLSQKQRECSDMREHQTFMSHMSRSIVRSKQALSQCSSLVFTGSLPLEVYPCARAEIPSSFATIALYDAILVSAAGTSQDAWSGRAMRRRTHRRAVCSIAYSPDSTRLVSASKDRDVDVWCTRTGPLRTFRTPSPSLFLTFSPDGS